MKNKFLFICICFIILSCCLIIPSKHPESVVFAKDNNQVKTPMMAIVIDDFGGYDRSGVESMLNINAPLTCAIMPNLDYSVSDMENATKHNKEVILHMPMQSHVNLPESWYGPTYIKNNDTPDKAVDKLKQCLTQINDAKGFNIHIGSGVSQNKPLMTAILEFAKQNNLLFLDSRTHLNTVCDNVAKDVGIVYLGRDEFLEPDHNKSYENVKHHLMIGKDLALEKGYSIVIGHVGAHGGENTAKAINDCIENIEKSGVKIVSLSEIYNYLNEK